MLPRMLAALTTVLAVGLVAPTAHAGATDHADRAATRHWIQISKVDGGYRYQASLHDNRLTVTRVGDRVRLADTTARVIRGDLPRGCRRAHADRGRAVSCRVPDGTSAAAPLLLDIEPQRGDDHVDASALGAEFKLSLLGAQGDDELLAGGGDDFINGADGVDQVHGGPGNDSIKVGAGDDIADGGEGDDVVIGTAGNDQLAGSVGDDRLEGGDGNDLLLGGSGSDVLLCGDGTDRADDHEVDDDTSRHCEIFLP